MVNDLQKLFCNVSAHVRLHTMLIVTPGEQLRFFFQWDHITNQANAVSIVTTHRCFEAEDGLKGMITKTNVLPEPDTIERSQHTTDHQPESTVGCF